MNKLIEIFFKLVKIDSPTGEEEKLVEFLINYLKNKADVVQKDNFGNVYVQVKGTGEPIFFSAHLDTVEPGRGIKPQIKNGYLVSDGITILGADNKSAVACILETVEILKERKIKHQPLEIIFTKSEEIGNCGAINFDFNLLKAKTGFCFDSSEPVGTIITASPYYERFDLKIIGKEAHASEPEKAINVILIFKEILNNLSLGRIDENSLLNLGILRSGQVRNTIPGEMLIKGEIRSLKQEILLNHKTNLVNKIKKVIAQADISHQLEFVRENPGYKHEETIELINFLKEKIRACGLIPRLVINWGVSDANIFNNKGLLCINLGDGTEFVHSKRERIKISEMENLVKLMLKLVENNFRKI